ncbi:formin-binding protein 1-like isoform X2 [Daktulosphaira vitifoliae]|uniref:formin-binding protein 1-like isoform X2 n=1 Tax=Daktulosphaira vitifoliae TaxID=58002 RepID=UPI0021AA896F|nr:formin-binding protein 1-like isoform X2 [Daktulosphaira vitifoliae]
MSWGTELWDQYDNLSFHTQKGIDFLERYGHFIRDRCLIEMEYAGKLRRLVKNYQPKKKEEEEYQYSTCKAFKGMLCEVNDLAGQHEVIAENLQSDVIREINFLVKDIKEERKKLLQDSAKYVAMINNQVASLERSRKNYEKAFKEAERALDNFQRADADLNLSRAEVEKQRMNMAIKNQHCEESKNEYANQLQKTNELQSQHYKALMPEVFRQLQELDEKRIRNVRHFMAHSADVERNVFPIINKCLDGIINAANQINEKQDTILVIERYKSGFEPPGDFPFDDLSRGGESTPLVISGGHTTLSSGNGAHRTDSMTVKGTMSAGKLKKRVGLFAIFSSNKLMDVCSSVKNNLSNSGDKDDYSELPPNQRRKKILQKLDEIQAKLHQEIAAKDGLMKMKGVYESNPALGDPMSTEGQLSECSQRIDKLNLDMTKYQGLLQEVECNGGSPAGNRKYEPTEQNGIGNGSTNNLSNHKLNVPDGKAPLGEDESLSRSASDSSVSTPAVGLNNSRYAGETVSLGASRHSLMSNEDVPYYDLHDLPPLGTCTALYAFEATSEGSIPMFDGEQLLIIEQDQGDGWTRVRRQPPNVEEGFVPTSYISIHSS